MLQTVYQLTSGKATGAGLGWHILNVSIGDDSNSSIMIGSPVSTDHSTGSSVGGTTSFMTFPEERIVIAVVSNVSYAKGLSQLAISLAKLFNQESGRIIRK